MVRLKGLTVTLSVAAFLASQSLARSQAQPTTRLSGVTVEAHLRIKLDGLTVRPPRRCLPPLAKPYADTPKPKVVSTFPAPGSKISPGILVLRVTFDLPMICAGRMTDAKPLRSPCTGTVSPARLSFDRKIFWTACRVKKDTKYGLELNDGGDRQHGFVSLAGKVADPYPLTFETSDDAPVNTVKAALDRAPKR